MPAASAHSRCGPATNNYLNCSSFRITDDGVRARKEHFYACHFLLLDDLGTKVPLELLRALPLSWRLETSPGNYQGGILFREPITDAATAKQLLDALIAAGLCDAGASGPTARWARLPIGINGKLKYRADDGTPFRCKLVEWHPSLRYTPTEIAERLHLNLDKPAQTPKGRVPQRPRTENPYFVEAADENPVITALRTHGLYKRLIAPGKHEVTCPWVHEHTDALDTGAAYFEPNSEFPVGGYCCQHSHRDQYRIPQLLQHLDVGFVDARNRPTITVAPGAMHSAVDAAERVLAGGGRYFQAGGMIATVGKDPVTGDPRIIPANVSSLTLDLSRSAEWVSEGKDGAKSIDPSPKHVKALHESQDFRHLPKLTGFARQPYFRDSDGTLVSSAGYDAESERIGVFEASKYRLPMPTREEAEKGLAELKSLLSEFHFASEQDRAATLSALLTAAVRPSLPVAPAFHVQASTPGSGKTYLCELIGLFAGPAPNVKVTYPASAEEATKMMLAVLMSAPGVVEFDDMDSDWKPFSPIKRALTASTTSDRMLGVSKTITVSTRTLFLGSGNNVGPTRDLLRRVLTIRLEPQVQSPATLKYASSPVARVRAERERFVVAALTIIRAWQAAGSPRSSDAIASYGGEWSDYCRHPLIWLGIRDPVATIVTQLSADPEEEALGRAMTQWHRQFGTKPVTVREVKAQAVLNDELQDALTELPVTDFKGGINSNKLGWYLRGKIGRIVNSRKFERVEASERTAWALRPAGPVSPVCPPLAASEQAASQTSHDEIDHATF